WLQPALLDRNAIRALVVGLVAIKSADALVLTRQGLCARFTTAAPYKTTVLTIPIEEPGGALRSWDVRADWRDPSPACTMIVERPYAERSSFPAWFTNITGFAKPGPPIFLDVSGYVRVKNRGLLVVDVDRDMRVSGRLGSHDVASTDGRPMLAALDAGVQTVNLHAELTGDYWRLVPTLDGRDAFSAASFTAREPGAFDRAAGVFGAIETAIVVLLAAVWLVSLAVEYRESPALLAWCFLS